MTFMVKLPIVSHHRWRKIVEENVRECEADFRTVVRLSEGYILTRDFRQVWPFAEVIPTFP